MGGGGLDHTEHLQGCTRRGSDGGNPLCQPQMHRVALWVLLGPLVRKKGFFFPRNEDLSPKKLAGVFSSIEPCGSPIE